MTDRIGFIGLGSMGMPMTRMLAENGHSLLVHDAEPVVREYASELPSVDVAENATAVAAHTALLFTCVPNDDVLRALYLGEGGILAGAAPELITVDCSTVSPDTTREIYAALAERGTSHLDASMLGSVPQAETGQIGFVVGGDGHAFERAKPLLEILGKMVKHVGPSGSANQVKLIHQTLVAGHAVAVAEALALCMATNTDIDAFYDVVCNGGGFAYSRYFEKRTPRMRADDFSPLFSLDLMRKDAGLARDLAESVGMETPLLDRVLAVFDSARSAGHGREDFSAVARIYEASSGQRLADS